jgi:hypothetical protein
MIVVTVRPLPGGWAVHASGLAGDMVFRSGAAAELAARRLAQQIADAGDPARLVVQLKDGSEGGRFLFPPSMHPKPQEAWGQAA